MDPLEQRIGRTARERLAKARVGVAGAGGLGSNIAVMLARSGVGHLVVADFDEVEESNLNRQHYIRQDIGMPKVDAIARQLRAIDPAIDIRAHCVRVTERNAQELFGACDIVCEAFDDAQAKAMLVERLLMLVPGPTVIAGSGMAGVGPASDIVTRRVGKRLFVCGDGTSDVEAGDVLFAPRVTLCAAQQALVAVRIILGKL